MLSSLDFHSILLSVVLLGVIVAVKFLFSPMSILFISSFICIPVASIVAGIVVVDVLVLLLDDFEDEELDVLLLLDDELLEYGHTPLVCKWAGFPPQW